MIKNNQVVLYYLLIISFFTQIFSQNYDALLEDTITCMGNENTNNCTSVKLSSGVYQCCKLKTTTYSSDYSLCSVQVTPISTFKNYLELKSTKALFKEIFGYVIYNTSYTYNYDYSSNTYTYNYDYYSNYLKIKMDYICKDGNATLKFGYDTYTNSEISVLQSSNHCLRYIYYDKLFTSKQDCFNSVLTQNAKDAGLSCGYFEFHLKYSDGLTDTIQICNIFNNDLISYGQLDDKTKESFESIVSTNKNSSKTVVSYNVEFSDKNGNTLVYDSTSQKVTSSTSNSKMNSISKYLMLFIVLLL
jgi:hypothetical protein